MLTLEEMKERKKQLGYTNKRIAEETGIPLGTVQKIFAGVTHSPRIDRMLTLDALLGGEEQTGTPPKEGLRQTGYGASAYRYDQEGERGNADCCLREGSAAYGWTTYDERDPSGGKDPKQGRYTVDDYLAIPDERRVELIDGFIYDMAAPSYLHQTILRELAFQFYQCMENHPECELFFAPADVQLGRNRKTVVQPDLFIICNRKRQDNDMLREPPDLVAEIVSPSSRTHDMFRKLNKYRFAGIREYWIIDPQRCRVLIYDLEHDLLPVTWDFTDRIPVGISQGTCSIDFQKISDRAKRYLEGDHP